MVAEPPDTPVTSPNASTVAMAVLLLDQLPPLTASASVVIAPWQTVVVPVIAVGGIELTVRTAVTVPQPVV